MRATAACPWCRRPVRTAMLMGGEETCYLDPRPARDGVVWVLEWGEFHVPVVVVEDRPQDVPGNHPFRYHIHTCK